MKIYYKINEILCKRGRRGSPRADILSGQSYKLQDCFYKGSWAYLTQNLIIFFKKYRKSNIVIDIFPYRGRRHGLWPLNLSTFFAAQTERA